MIAAGRQPAIDAQNPWPGLSAFDEAAERFFNGRAEETATLRRLVLQGPLTVVYGASGLGKTSLLQAGLFPLLRPERFLPVYIRLDPADRERPLIDQVALALQAELRARQVEAPSFLSGESLWEYLHRAALELWSPQNQLLTPVFVFDQFEEVFTLGAGNREALRQFAVDLADLVENRIPDGLEGRLHGEDEATSQLALDSQRYKVVLSFREDFLPSFESLKRRMPSIMRNRFRLLPMAPRQAFEAVHLTAPHLADADMAWRIVSFVAGDDVAAAEPDEGRDRDDVQVEPALLSLVCHGLNERRKAQGKPAFDRELLEGTGHAIVAEFYRDALIGMPPRVRAFIQDELITELGYRKPCDVDDARRVHGVTDAQLRTLVDRRLLRIEPVRGSERIELTHDLLTPVVREARDRARADERVAAERRERRRLVAIGGALGVIAIVAVLFGIYANRLRLEAVSATQTARENETKAAASEAEARANADKLAERTRELQDALAQATAARDQASTVSARNKELADEANDARALALKGEEEARRQAGLALDAQGRAEGLQKEAAAAAALARNEAERARINADLANKNRLAAEAASREEERVSRLSTAQALAARARIEPELEVAAQMAVHAFLLHRDNACPVLRCPDDDIDPNVLSALQATFNRVTRRTRPGQIGSGGIVVASGGGSILQVVPGEGRSPLRLVSARSGGNVVVVDLSKDRRDLSSGGADEVRTLPLSLDRRVTAVAVAPSGAAIAAGRLDGSISIWPLAAGTRPWPAQPPTRSWPTALIFWPDLDTVTAARADVSVQQFDRSGPLRAGRVGANSINALATAPDGKTLLIGTNLGIHRWAGGLLDGTASFDVRSMASAPDRRAFAFGDRSGAVRVARWNGSSLTGVQAMDTRHASAVNAVAFSPRGRLLASAGADGTVRVFPAEDAPGVAPTILEGHSGWVESAVFADDALLYSSGVDGTIRAWITRMDSLAAAICAEAARARLVPDDAGRTRLGLALGAGGAAADACTMLGIGPVRATPAATR